MLVAAKTNAESASAVPDIVAGVVVNPAVNGKRNSVEEHITCEVLVRLLGHDHYTVVGGLPIRQDNDVPRAVVEVNVVVT